MPLTIEAEFQVVASYGGSVQSGGSSAKIQRKKDSWVRARRHSDDRVLSEGRGSSAEGESELEESRRLPTM